MSENELCITKGPGRFNLLLESLLNGKPVEFTVDDKPLWVRILQVRRKHSDDVGGIAAKWLIEGRTVVDGYPGREIMKAFYNTTDQRGTATLEPFTH